jgi:hypothetical protein
MCRTIMCFMLLEITMMCMCRTICLKQINKCVESINCANSCMCDQCMSDLFYGQLLVVPNG